MIVASVNKGLYMDDWNPVQ